MGHVMKKVIQFSYKLDEAPAGVPVVDCRVIDNPHRKADTDEARMALVEKHQAFPVLVEAAVGVLEAHDSVAIGCTWGRHRSGAVAREVAKRTGAKIVKKYRN